MHGQWSTQPRDTRITKITSRGRRSGKSLKILWISQRLLRLSLLMLGTATDSLSRLFHLLPQLPIHQALRPLRVDLLYHQRTLKPLPLPPLLFLLLLLPLPLPLPPFQLVALFPPEGELGGELGGGGTGRGQGAAVELEEVEEVQPQQKNT